MRSLLAAGLLLAGCAGSSPDAQMASVVRQTSAVTIYCELEASKRRECEQGAQRSCPHGFVLLEDRQEERRFTVEKLG